MRKGGIATPFASGRRKILRNFVQHTLTSRQRIPVSPHPTTFSISFLAIQSPLSPTWKTSSIFRNKIPGRGTSYHALFLPSNPPPPHFRLSHRLQTGHSFPSEPNWKIIVQPVVCFHTIRPVFSKITPFSPVLGRLFKNLFSKSPRFFKNDPLFCKNHHFLTIFKISNFRTTSKNTKGGTQPCVPPFPFSQIAVPFFGRYSRPISTPSRSRRAILMSSPPA